MFDGSGDEYKKIVKRYKAYIKLYREWNNGSAEGVSSFSEFYWRFTYNVKYEDPSTMNSNA